MSIAAAPRRIRRRVTGQHDTRRLGVPRVQPNDHPDERLDEFFAPPASADLPAERRKCLFG